MYSTFGIIETYANIDVGVVLGKMCKTSLYFYFPLFDAITLIKEKITNKKILCVCPFKLYHFLYLVYLSIRGESIHGTYTTYLLHHIC